MDKKVCFLLLFMIMIPLISPVIADNGSENHFNDFIDEKIYDIKSYLGLDGFGDKEPGVLFETVVIDVYGYEQLKKEMEKHSTLENKSYIFNLHDGDYNITGPFRCGNSHSRSKYTINGNGHVIDGQNKYQFMRLYSNLKVNNLTVKNTAFNESFNSSSVITMVMPADLYISNCVFANNHGKDKGCVITNRGNCYIKNSKFYNNSADEMGGAIWSTGEYGGSLTIKNCVFEGNYANFKDNNERTSIIYIVSYGKNIIENNLFKNNHGRCIHAYNQANTFILKNKFINNSLEDDEVIRGGIIDNYESNMKISGNAFIDDRTTGELRGGILYHEIGNLEFVNNTVNITSVNPDPSSKSECSKGGVIFNRNASITVANNEFNNVLNGNYSRGGVIYNNLGEITLKDNIFNNKVKGNNIDGLTIFNDVNSELNLKNNTFASEINGKMVESDDKYIFNSDVINDEGNGTIGIVNYI